MTLLFLPLLTACAPDLRDLDDDGVLDVALPDTGTVTTEEGADTPATDDGPETTFTPSVTVLDEGDGVFRVSVDAREGTSYLDLATPEQVAEADGWEIGFERYIFSVNGGTSGPGGVEAVRLDGVDFASVTTPPDDGWTTDSDDGAALEDWYVYDSVEHVLYAADAVYVLRIPDGDAWKVQFLGYYDDFGNTGFVGLRVAGL